MNYINKGVYPTMITPYQENGEIDYGAVRALVDWYAERGCTGIFAVCQSSEMMFLSLEERVKLASTVVDQAKGRLSVVASGHCSESLEGQLEEMNRMSETGIDAFVLISNRFDLHNDGDAVWLQNAERLLERGNSDIPLGIYECPMPYKRLVTPKILDWCLKTGRFRFIKDTCCDPDLLRARGEQLKGSEFMLLNANGQTFLHSLQNGGSGYSGIMVNFHPELYVWLWNNFEKEPEKAERVSDFISMMAFTEGPAYPCTAKYHHSQHGVPMTLLSRSCDKKRVTPYQKLIVEQMHRAAEEMKKELGV